MPEIGILDVYASATETTVINDNIIEPSLNDQIQYGCVCNFGTAHEEYNYVEIYFHVLDPNNVHITPETDTFHFFKDNSEKNPTGYDLVLCVDHSHNSEYYNYNYTSLKITFNTKAFPGIIPWFGLGPINLTLKIDFTATTAAHPTNSYSVSRYNVPLSNLPTNTDGACQISYTFPTPTDCAYNDPSFISDTTVPYNSWLRVFGTVTNTNDGKGSIRTVTFKFYDMANTSITPTKYDYYTFSYDPNHVCKTYNNHYVHVDNNVVGLVIQFNATNFPNLVNYQDGTNLKCIIVTNDGVNTTFPRIWNTTFTFKKASTQYINTITDCSTALTQPRYNPTDNQIPYATWGLFPFMYYTTTIQNVDLNIEGTTYTVPYSTTCQQITPTIYVIFENENNFYLLVKMDEATFTNIQRESYTEVYTISDCTFNVSINASDNLDITFKVTAESFSNKQISTYSSTSVIPSLLTSCVLQLDNTWYTPPPGYNPNAAEVDYNNWLRMFVTMPLGTVISNMSIVFRYGAWNGGIPIEGGQGQDGGTIMAKYDFVYNQSSPCTANNNYSIYLPGNNRGCFVFQVNETNLPGLKDTNGAHEEIAVFVDIYVGSIRLNGTLAIHKYYPPPKMYVSSTKSLTAPPTETQLLDTSNLWTSSNTVSYGDWVKLNINSDQQVGSMNTRAINLNEILNHLTLAFTLIRPNQPPQPILQNLTFQRNRNRPFLRNNKFSFSLRDDRTAVFATRIVDTTFPLLMKLFGMGQASIQITATINGGRTLQTLLTITNLPPPPISNICFVKDTLIQTDQGYFKIQQLMPYHTIRNQPIQAITKTVTREKELVEFQKDALGKNIPFQTTVCSLNHQFYINNVMVPAKYLVNGHTIRRIPYKKEALYNVLLKDHALMAANGIITETLDPSSFKVKVNPPKKLIVFK